MVGAEVCLIVLPFHSERTTAGYFRRRSAPVILGLGGFDPGPGFASFGSSRLGAAHPCAFMKRRTWPKSMQGTSTAFQVARAWHSVKFPDSIRLEVAERRA
jgi:hypothetical protein